MNKRIFYQSKYVYYRLFHMWIIIAASLSSIMYYLSDCYLFGKFTTETLLARTFILVPLAVFMILYFHTKNYRIMIISGYIVAHGVMWCTIWACYYLDDLSFACVGFIIINFIFLALGITAPMKTSVISHGLLFADIFIANTFLHYPDFAMMLLLGIPLYFGICVFDIAIEKTYKDQYEIKKQLEYSLKHDALTGAYNRNIINSLIKEDNSFTEFLPGRSGIVMYDLDFFKKINDTYGHLTGDKVLVETAQTILKELDSTEFLIRWGGEEFVILLHGNPEELCKRAETLRARVEKLSHIEGHTTISVGVAPYTGGSYQKAVENADFALYKAKGNGRNRIFMYETE